MSVFFVFKRDIRNILLNWKLKQTRMFILYLILGTVPSIIIGIGFKDFFESLFNNLFAVGTSLIFTGFVLIITFFINDLIINTRQRALL